MRFRVDCRLIDMSQDRKNQRDQTQPRYTQELDRSYFMRLTLLKRITLKIQYYQVKSERDLCNAILFSVKVQFRLRCICYCLCIYRLYESA